MRRKNPKSNKPHRKPKDFVRGKLKCAFCQGKGIQPGTERLSCIVCGGTGRIAIRQPYGLCKECEGRGRKQGATLYCLSCHGKGFIEEKSYPQIAKPLVSKKKRKSIKRKRGKSNKRKRAMKPTGKKEGKKSAKPKARKSFFKKFLGTLKIL